MVNSSSTTELMESITYLNRKSHMGHSEILKLSYATFLSYLKHNRIMDLRETEEGREYLAKVERLQTKTADISGLRQLQNTLSSKGGE